MVPEYTAKLWATPLRCSVHGEVKWEGHLICSDCNRIYVAGTHTLYKNMCKCGNRFLPDNMLGHEFSARRFCPHCAVDNPPEVIRHQNEGTPIRTIRETAFGKAGGHSGPPPNPKYAVFSEAEWKDIEVGKIIALREIKRPKYYVKINPTHAKEILTGRYRVMRPSARVFLNSKVKGVEDVRVLAQT